MFKLVQAFAFLIAISTSVPAFAELVTFRSAGVITGTGEDTFGEDQLGLFGTPGESLIGKSFVLTSSFDTANLNSVGSHEWYSLAQGFGTAFDTSITIGSRTISYHVEKSVIFSSMVVGMFSAIGQGYDFLVFESSGSVSGGFLNVSQTVQSGRTAFIGLLPTFATKAFLAPSTGDYARSHWSFGSTQGITRFQTLSVLSMEINPSPVPVPVPEPGSLNLLLAGLGLLMALRRRSIFL